jgi:hypothetical protein
VRTYKYAYDTIYFYFFLKKKSFFVKKKVGNFLEFKKDYSVNSTSFAEFLEKFAKISHIHESQTSTKSAKHNGKF